MATNPTSAKVEMIGVINSTFHDFLNDFDALYDAKKDKIFSFEEMGIKITIDLSRFKNDNIDGASGNP